MMHLWIDLQCWIPELGSFAANNSCYLRDPCTCKGSSESIMGSSNGSKSGTKRWCCCEFCSCLWKSLIVVSLIGTNFMALYSLTSSQHLDQSIFSSPLGITQITSDISGVHHELELAQMQLAGIRNDLSAFLERLRVQQQQKKNRHKKEEEPVDLLPENANDKLNLMESIPSSELQKFVEIRDLPLGHNHALQISKMVSPIGHACARSPELLEKFMDYDIGGMCPDDSDVAQKLMLKGCEPLPRRRCFSRSPVSESSQNPLPFPGSLWSLPPDDSIIWTHYSCKAFSCLNNQRKRFSRVSVEDCSDCFDLEKENSRWVSARSNNDIIIDGVLKYKQGTIRIGLDLGGGTGTFAARMRESNVTIITTTLNLNAPFNEFVASRGLIPLHVTISQRLPFFDNIMDIIHCMDVLGNWVPGELFEFLLYDLDRILRPGGLLWLGRFSCTQDELEEVYAPMIERMGYDKVRWVVADDKADHQKQVYLSALLEKPVRD